MEVEDKVAIIIPSYNESKSIVKVVNEVQNQLKCEIIIVDDASTDETCQIVENKIKIPNVHLLKHSINLGGGAAVQTGVWCGLLLGCKYFVQVDGDGQHPASQISTILEPILHKETDLVIGSRYLNQTKYQTSMVRKAGIMGSSKTISVLSGTKITDVNSGFRAFNVDIAKKIIQDYDARHPTFKFTSQICGEEYRVKEVPVEMNKRQFGTSEFTKKRLAFYPLKIILDIIRIYL